MITKDQFNKLTEFQVSRSGDKETWDKIEYVYRLKNFHFNKTGDNRLKEIIQNNNLKNIRSAYMNDLYDEFGGNSNTSVVHNDEKLKIELKCCLSNLKY